MQILTDELVKEVENSIAEFKHHNQDYDEDRVKAQVTLLHWVQILMLQVSTCQGIHWNDCFVAT